jgi:hypothetical protein
MAGTDDEWPILADPNPDDEEWPLQPNIDPAPAPTEPTELRPADQPFPTYQSKQPDQPVAETEQPFVLHARSRNIARIIGYPAGVGLLAAALFGPFGDTSGDWFF